MFKKRPTTNTVFLSIVFSGQIEFENFYIEDIAGASKGKKNKVGDYRTEDDGWGWSTTKQISL